MVPGRDIKALRESFYQFLSEKLKLYPTLEDSLDKLIEPSTTTLAELLTHSTEAKVFSFQVEQRGKLYLVTRGSTIRGQHGYETFSYHLMKDDTPTNVENNPNLTIEFITKSLQAGRLAIPH